MRNCQKTCLIVPCYNEEKRLDVQAFLKLCDDDLIFVFVDDGSRDATASLLRPYTSANWHVLSLCENQGKSEAVRQGALYIKEYEIDKRVSWIGFWDSDLSVPLHEVANFYKYLKVFDIDADCIIGSRIQRMGSEILRSPIRHYLGRCFSTFVSFLFGIQFYDTQCGAKLFKRGLLDICFDKPFVSDWIFDVELLIRLREYQVVEYPLQEWREKPGSKINFLKVGFTVLYDLMRMRKRLR